MPVSLRWLVSTGLLIVSLTISLLLLPSLCSGNGHPNPPHQQFHGMVVPVYENSNNQSADKLIIYEVRVNCLQGCKPDDPSIPSDTHCTVQTSHDPPAEAGKFSCPLDAEPDTGEPGGFKAITELEVTVFSVHELGGHRRSHSWKLKPQFDKRHQFNMGFFTPSPEGTPFFLSFQIDKAHPLPDIVIESDGQTPVWKYELIVLRPEKKGSWNRMRKMFVKARTYGSKKLTADEWRGNKEFQVILDKRDKSNGPPSIDKYLHDYAKPTLELVLRKVPVCEMCSKKATNSKEGTKEEKGQIYKFPPYNNHYHVNCFLERFPKSNSEALLFGKKTAPIEHIYTATLEMPILQNNQAAEIYTYTINTSIMEEEKFQLDEIVYLSLKEWEEDEKEAEEKKAANDKHEKRNKGENETSSSKASASTGTKKEVPPQHHSSSKSGLLAPAANQQPSAEMPSVQAAGLQVSSHVHNRHQSPSPPTTNAAGMSASAASSISSNLASDSASNNLTNVGSEKDANIGHHHDANAALTEPIILVSGGGTSSRSSLKKKSGPLNPIHEEEEPPEPPVAADDQASPVHPHPQSSPTTNAAGVSNRNLPAFDSNLANISLANPMPEEPPEPAEKASCCCCGDPFSRMLKKGSEKRIFFDGSIPSGKPSEPTVADTVQVPHVYHQQSSPPANAARESAAGSSNLASNNSSDNAGSIPPSSLKNKLKKKKPILSVQLPVKGEGNLFRMQREQWERKKEEGADKLTTILPIVDVESPRLEPMVLPANAAAGDHEPLILQQIPLSPSSSSASSSSSSNQSSPVAAEFAAPDDLLKTADEPMKKFISAKEDEDIDEETRLTKALKSLQTGKEEDRVKKLSMLTDEEQLELATRASLDEMQAAEAKAKNKNVGGISIKEPSAAKVKAAEKSAGKVLQIPAAADPKDKGKRKMYKEDEAHPVEEVKEEDTKVSVDVEEKNNKEKKKKDNKEEENNVKRLPPIMEEEGEEEEEKVKEERKMVKNPLSVNPKKEEAEEEDDIFFDAAEHLDLHQDVPEKEKAEQSQQKKKKNRSNEEKKKLEEEKKETKPKEKKPEEKKPTGSEKKTPEESKKKEKKLNTTTSGSNSKLADVNVEEARGKGIGVNTGKKEDAKIEKSPDKILLLTAEPHLNSEDENDLPPPLEEETYNSDDGERRMTPSDEYHTNVHLHHDNQREPPHEYWNPFAYTMSDQSLSPPPSNDEHQNQNQQDVDEEEEGDFERIANFVRPHF